jgi:hypothetical protein
MSVATISVVAFASMFGAAIAGMLLRSLLPERYLSTESKEVIRLGAALIATMSAMLLGLLISSTRGAYEEKRNQVIRMTADLIELDILLRDFGAAGRPVRQAMRDAVAPMIDGIWRGHAGAPRPDADAVPDAGTEQILAGIEQLPTLTDGQGARRERAIALGLELAQIQFILFSQPANAISTPFITIVVLWLTFVFGTFTLSAPPNFLIGVVLMVAALSAASAIFLILDLDRPFGGMLQIPAASLRSALPPLDALAP